MVFEWVEDDRTCPMCHNKGPHILVDDTLFCGTCDKLIEGVWEL